MGNRSSSNNDIIESLAVTHDRLTNAEFLYQVEDGTVFYVEPSGIMSLKMRIFVKWEGREIEADLPERNVSGIHPYGNCIYFYCQKKLYTAEFIAPTIHITHVRDLIEGEKQLDRGLCERVRYGSKYVYRTCDDPETDAIFVDVPDNSLTNLRLSCIHRGKAIFVPTNYDGEAVSMLKLRENILVAEIRNVFLFVSRYSPAVPRNPFPDDSINEYHFTPYAQDASPFVYFTSKNDSGALLHTLDTTSMEFYPPFRIGFEPICHIGGVHDGTISFFTGTLNHSFSRPRMLTAQLLSEYYEACDSADELEEEISELVESSLQPSVDDVRRIFDSKFGMEFEIKRILGVGGFGVVFEAHNRLDHGKYAVKRICVDLRTEEKALAEVRAMAKLEHPGIIRYNSAWIERPPEGWQFNADTEMLNKLDPSSRTRFEMHYKFNSVFIYIQMQLCKYSLKDWLVDNNTLERRSAPRIKSWFKQVVQAVAYIHSRNLFHRDLKPANILFLDEDSLKLCDLGIATERQVGENEGTLISRSKPGTALYMSPEHLSCVAPYSSKADVFALGLILAELCVVMMTDERSQIFDSYRAGTQWDLITDAETAELIKWLTQTEPSMRPTCEEMLKHSYFF